MYNENKNKFHLLINSLKKLDEPYVYFKEDFLQKLNYEKNTLPHFILITCNCE